jgi:hypothetical protein
LIRSGRARRRHLPVEGPGRRPQGWRWESRVDVPAIALDHPSRQGVGPAKEGTGLGETTFGDQLADAGGPDDRPVERDRREHPCPITEALPELFEQLHVAGTTVAKGESVADANADDAAEIPDETADELGGGESAEALAEGYDHGGIEPEPGQLMETVFEGLQGRRGAVGRQDLVGVSVESDGNGETIVFAGVVECELDQALVAEVYSVEHSQRHTDGAMVSWQLIGPIEDFHGGVLSSPFSPR